MRGRERRKTRRMRMRRRSEGQGKAREGGLFVCQAESSRGQHSTAQGKLHTETRAPTLEQEKTTEEATTTSITSTTTITTTINTPTLTIAHCIATENMRHLHITQTCLLDFQVLSFE